MGAEEGLGEEDCQNETDSDRTKEVRRKKREKNLIANCQERV
jgi:hypothetical protein